MTTINNDRELLQYLGFNDATASKWIGRSRQSLSNGLSSARSLATAQKDSAMGLRYSDAMPLAPNDYFKLHEILLLVRAAQSLDYDCDLGLIRLYIEASRGDKKDLGYKLVMEQLADNDFGLKAMQLDAASALLLILPTSLQGKVKAGSVESLFSDMIERMPKKDDRSNVVILSPTKVDAQTAADRLGLRQDNCFGDGIIDLYLPGALVYHPGQEMPRHFALTEHGFIPGMKHNDTKRAYMLEYMLPADARLLLRPARPVRTASSKVSVAISPSAPN